VAANVEEKRKEDFVYYWGGCGNKRGGKILKSLGKRKAKGITILLYGR
jgi:hypothetical protein